MAFANKPKMICAVNARFDTRRHISNRGPDYCISRDIQNNQKTMDYCMTRARLMRFYLTHFKYRNRTLNRSTHMRPQPRDRVLHNIILRMSTSTERSNGTHMHSEPQLDRHERQTRHRRHQTQTQCRQVNEPNVEKTTLSY